MKIKVKDIDFIKVRRAAMDAIKTQCKCTGQYDPDANIAAAVEAAFREYEKQKRREFPVRWEERLVPFGKKSTRKQMKEILKRVQEGKGPSKDATDYELELWIECGRRGYINLSSSTARDEAGHWHIDLMNYVVTPAGIEWMSAPRPDLKGNISLWFSLIAIVITFLGSADSIWHNVKAFFSLLGMI